MSRTALFYSALLVGALALLPLLGEYFPRLACARLPRWWRQGAAALLLGGGAFLLLIERVPGPVRYCTSCGAAELNTEWRLRFSPWVLWHTGQVESTPFSTALGPPADGRHAHHWLAPQTVPNPLSVEAPPVVESLGFLNSPRVVHFTRDLMHFADPASRAAWRERLLDPSYSYLFDEALRFQRAPEAGFPEREKFLTWWGQNAFPLFNKLRAETEPD